MPGLPKAGAVSAACFLLLMQPSEVLAVITGAPDAGSNAVNKGLRYAAIAFALIGTIARAGAQEVSPANVLDLKLNPDQKHTIYLSISNQQQKETAPLTFRAAVGSVVPPSVNLQALPKTIVELVPLMQDYQYAMVANQVLLVDPKNRQVVDVIDE
jgi:hypothetical protein